LVFTFCINAIQAHGKVQRHDRKILEQEMTIAQLKQEFQSKLSQQQKQIEALTAGLQKGEPTACEASKPAPQMVLNQ
jgi:uncharacterized coiled-coil protein SlyX